MNADNRQNGRQPNEPETAETAAGPSTNDGQGIADSGMVSQAGTNEGEQNRFLIAGELILDLKDQRAFFGKDPISLPQKPFRLLKALMAEPQTLVSKSALFEVVWDGMAVGDAVLTTAMKELRQGLHDPARRPEWIETVHGQGYRFLKPVSRAAALPPATSSDGAVEAGSTAQGGTDAAHANADPNRLATNHSSGSSYDEASSVADVEEAKAADGLAPGSAASSGAKGGSGLVDRQDGPSIGLIAALLAAFAGVVFILFAQLGAPDAKNAPSAGVVGEDGARVSQANEGSQPTGPGQTRGGLPPAKSIAVLPFDDMSISADQEYFSDGVAEEILNALVRAPGLQVAARTSSFAFKGQNVDLRGVGQQLNVATILEGSVRKQGERVRVTAQLIQAKDGFHLWSETYDGSLDDIFELQERIARSVADALAVILDVESGDRLAKRLTSSKEAYDFFLKARSMVAHRFSEATLKNAIALLETAVELDPAFAEAWAELARATYFLPQYMPVADADPYLDRSIDAAGKAIALDPDLPRAYLAKAGVHSYRGEFAETYRSLSKAQELDPRDADIIGALGYYWSYTGHTERALPFLEKALSLDPINVTNTFMLGVAKMNAGDIEGAEQLLARALQDGHTPAALILPQIAALKGDRTTAVQRFSSGFEMANPALTAQFSGGADAASMAKLIGEALYGTDETALMLVRGGLKQIAQSEEMALNPAVLGMMVQTGEYDLFIQTFEKRKFSGGTFVLNIIWDDLDRTAGLRRHPRFSEFVENVGLADAWRLHGTPDGCREASNGEYLCS